ncbi:sodium:solute symporter [Pseudonocardia sp. DR1-2]|uniref:sodium:solute symporter n=1 Tax=Pseudonocardia sp. DR1-2 TaxID=2951168 RepID=UPI002044C8D1|nr:sodium:solute symporter [Pseudonocardia sp. DR1-2]MCM3848857.1 sodium:solute symporter [Pseudonocardia sp. DR1-2]
MDVAVVVLYLAAMIAFGFWGRRRTVDRADFLVAGRRLGPWLYSGTMAAVVLGGASTIGGVGLGYQYGLSGMWLVVAIGSGILVLSLAFSGRIQRLGVFTVGQMLELRYGTGLGAPSGIVMWAYTLMLAVTSTIAYATIFGVLLGLPRIPSILIGGAVVVVYSTLGGMWSVTLTDFVQFLIKTVGIFLVLLPVVLWRAGGWDGLVAAVPADALSLTTIGGGTIVTYFVTYGFGLLIGQDIWQRVFTARSPGVARWAGFGAGVYCLAYGVVGALIGTAAQVVVPGLAERDDAFAAVVEAALPPVLAGLVLAAALSAVMSTSSGALLATATVFDQDLLAALRRRRDARGAGTTRPDGGGDGDGTRDELSGNRWAVAVFGVVMIGIACLLRDVVAALTLAYGILVGGLLVPVLGGLLWRRATRAGALAAMGVGTLVTLGTMLVLGDLYANEPVFAGLGCGLVAFVAVSLATRPVDDGVRTGWDRRVGAAGGRD